MSAVEGAVEVVGRFTRALAAGDLESALQLVHDDLVFSEPESLVFGGEWIGRQGVRDLMAAISRSYRIRIGPPDVVAAGDQVLARVHGTVSSRATRREAVLDALDLYHVEDGRIRRVEVFYKDSAAVVALCHDETTTTGRAKS